MNGPQIVQCVVYHFPKIVPRPEYVEFRELTILMPLQAQTRRADL